MVVPFNGEISITAPYNCVRRGTLAPKSRGRVLGIPNVYNERTLEEHQSKLKCWGKILEKTF